MILGFLMFLLFTFIIRQYFYSLWQGGLHVNVHGIKLPTWHISKCNGPLVNLKRVKVLPLLWTLRRVVQILFKSCFPNQSELILTEWFNNSGDKELRHKIKTNWRVYSPSIIKRSQLDPPRRIIPYLLRLSFKHVFSTNIIRAWITLCFTFQRVFFWRIKRLHKYDPVQLIKWFNTSGLL